MFQKVSVFIDSKLRKRLAADNALSILGAGLNQGLLLAGWVSQMALFSDLKRGMDPYWWALYVNEQSKKFLDSDHAESKVAITHLRRAARIEVTIELSKFQADGFVWTLYCFAKSAKQPFYELRFSISLDGKVSGARHFMHDADHSMWIPA